MRRVRWVLLICSLSFTASPTNLYSIPLNSKSNHKIVGTSSLPIIILHFVLYCIVLYCTGEPSIDLLPLCCSSPNADSGFVQSTFSTFYSELPAVLILHSFLLQGVDFKSTICGSRQEIWQHTLPKRHSDQSPMPESYAYVPRTMHHLLTPLNCRYLTQPNTNGTIHQISL